jgi:peptidoglycan/LPS O-acetylase OafA/YrhL
MPQRDHLSVLDGLRAISIALVLATHMLPLGPKFLRLNETTGAMGMSLFFALSGFLIVSSLLQNSNVAEFLIKRITRILPLACAYALIVFTLIHFSPSSFFWTLSFVENYSAHLNAYNSHFWSLCVEFQFYLFIALVVLFAGKRGVWVVWPACLIVTAMRVNAGAYVNIQTHLRVDEILAGGCLAILHDRYRFYEHRLVNAAVALAALFWFASSSPFSGWLQYLRPYASASLLAAVLCHKETILAGALSSRPMRYLARISYALYVIHHATYQGWLDTGTTFERYLLKRPISFVLTFGLAHLSTFYWERPWLDAGRKWIAERRMRRSGETNSENSANVPLDSRKLKLARTVTIKPAGEHFLDR